MSHEKRFSGDIERLRSPQRVDRLGLAQVVRSCLEGNEILTMLDAGTGSGLFAERFVHTGIIVSGIDANFTMLPAARGFVPQAHFTQAVIERIPFSSNAFDMVFYGLVLHEADDPLLVLRESRRVSRKRVCILEWPYRDQSFSPPMEHRIDPAQLEALFVKVGFPRWDCVAFANVDLYRLNA
jgi:ubiquinone/menaquinone biosynthesis C-methylase UbiE